MQTLGAKLADAVEFFLLRDSESSNRIHPDSHAKIAQHLKNWNQLCASSRASTATQARPAQEPAMPRWAVEVALAEFVTALDEKRAAGEAMDQTVQTAERSFAATDRIWANLEPARAALATQPAPSPGKPVTCEWAQDGNDDGSWFSACGGDPWYFESDDPTKNGMRFCVHCGKRMVQHGIGAASEPPEAAGVKS